MSTTSSTNNIQSNAEAGQSIDDKSWTSQEKEILKANLDGYKAQKKGAKVQWLRDNVFENIRLCYGDRYSEAALQSDAAARKQWKKRKNVSHFTRCRICLLVRHWRCRGIDMFTVPYVKSGAAIANSGTGSGTTDVC